MKCFTHIEKGGGRREEGGGRREEGEMEREERKRDGEVCLPRSCMCRCLMYLGDQSSLDFSCVSNMGATAQVDKRATPAEGYRDTDMRSGKRKNSSTGQT